MNGGSGFELECDQHRRRGRTSDGVHAAWKLPEPVLIRRPGSSLIFQRRPQVSLQIVDMLGREVMTLPAKEFEAGANQSIELNAINLASGTYLYRMIATGAESRYVKTGRMTLVK